MHFSTSSAIVALSSFSAFAAALPLASQNASDSSILDRRAAPKYSVVQVDGGPTTSTPSTTTELRTITHSASASSVTQVLTLTKSGEPTTIVVTTTIEESSSAIPSVSSALTGASSVTSESPEGVPTVAPVPPPALTQTSNSAWPTYSPSWNTSSAAPTTSCNETIATASFYRRAPTETLLTDLPKLPSASSKAGSFNATRVPGAIRARDLPSGASAAAAFPTGFYKRQAAAATGLSEPWNQTEAPIEARAVASEAAPAAASGFLTRRSVAAATGTASTWNSTIGERAVPFEPPVHASSHAPERRALTAPTGVASAWNSTSASLEGRAVPSEGVIPIPTGFLTRRLVPATTGGVGASNSTPVSA